MAPKYTITIDPGLRGCGLAVGDLTTLTHASYVVGEMDTRIRRAPVWQAMAKAVRAAADAALPHMGSDAELVIELPQVYKASHQRGGKERTDPQDLIELAAVVGGITALLGLPTVAWLPREWKGQVPKEIMHDRAEARLSSAELAVIQLPGATLAHNVWDAVSIFLRRKGRL